VGQGLVIDQRKILGGATVIVGVAALYYASWELVSLGTVVILLFGLACLVGYLAENIRFMSAALLSASVVVSRWGVHESF
jgi:phage shock protein PspC (stress-responsive transcriptional regulator)